MSIDVSQEWLDQQSHERMKAFMQDKGWSTAIYADPAELYEIKVSFTDDDDADLCDVYDFS